MLYKMMSAITHSGRLPQQWTWLRNLNWRYLPYIKPISPQNMAWYGTLPYQPILGSGNSHWSIHPDSNHSNRWWILQLSHSYSILITKNAQNMAWHGALPLLTPYNILKFPLAPWCWYIYLQNWMNLFGPFCWQICQHHGASGIDFKHFTQDSLHSYPAWWVGCRNHRHVWNMWNIYCTKRASKCHELVVDGYY